MKHGVARTGVRFEQFAGYPGWILEPRLYVYCGIKLNGVATRIIRQQIHRNDLIVHVRHAVFLSPVIYHAKITQLNPHPSSFLLEHGSLVGVEHIHHIAQFTNGGEGRVVCRIPVRLIENDETARALIQYTDNDLV